MCVRGWEGGKESDGEGSRPGRISHMCIAERKKLVKTSRLCTCFQNCKVSSDTRIWWNEASKVGTGDSGGLRSHTCEGLET